MSNNPKITNDSVSFDALRKSFADASVVGFVPKSFGTNLLRAFHFMDEQNADLDGLFDDAHLFLEADETENPRHQEYADDAEDLHNEILSYVDSICLFYAFMLKNEPYLRAGLAQIKQDLITELDMRTDYYESAARLKADVEELFDDVFPVLNKLREEFSVDICDRRKADAWGDQYSAHFLEGRELTHQNMTDRMEFLFFEQYGIPLNVFDRSEGLESYIDECLQREWHVQSICDDLKRGDLQEDFPGFHLVSLKGVTPRPQTRTVISENLKNLKQNDPFVMPIFKPRNGLI